MSNYLQKQATVFRLIKLARLARHVREQRALQKYAQAVQMQKAALSNAGKIGLGTGVGALGGGLLGAGIGYGLGKKDKKLLSTLIGAGIGTAGGAGLGALGGWALGSRDSVSPPLSVSPYSLEGPGRLVSELPSGLDLDNDFEELDNPEDFGLSGKGWRINIGAGAPGKDRYIISPTGEIYHTSLEALQRMSDARRVVNGEEAYFGRNNPAGSGYDNRGAFWR